MTISAVLCIRSRLGRGLVLVVLLMISAAVLAVDPPPRPPWPWGDAGSYSAGVVTPPWPGQAPDSIPCTSGPPPSPFGTKPLEIRPLEIREVQFVPYEPIHFHYQSQALDVVHDGLGVQVVTAGGSWLRVQGETFDLDGLHFHAPGEHLVNGRGAAAEVHFSHRDRAGRDLIVVVRIEPAQRSNSTLARIVERLPLRSGERLSYQQVGVNPLFILPTDRSYYIYTGSLATSPCSAPVTLILFEESIGLEPPLLERLAQASGRNTRQLQPVNGRPVYLSRRR